MALKGNLRDFSFIELLNLINLASKTGSIIIKGTDDTAWIFFTEGKLAYAQLSMEDNRLISIIRRSGKLSAAQLSTIKKAHQTDQMSDKELGLMLINNGYLTQTEILQIVSSYYEFVVNQLFQWLEGSFNYDPAVIPQKTKILARVDLESIILEGTRKMEELDNLQYELPNLEMALDFPEKPKTDISKVKLTRREWSVITRVNPKNTMQQIAEANNLSDLEIRQTVYGLLQAGLVEIALPEGFPIPAKQRLPQLTGQKKEEQVTLINRIMHRIRSL